MLRDAANGLPRDGRMSTGDSQRREGDPARPKLQEHRDENASKLSLDDRIQCGSGWRAIVETFLRDAEHPGFVFLSAGERWGALNLQFVCDDPEEIEALVQRATELSLRTCERCGKPGHLRRGMWWRTLCDLHSR